MNLTNKQILIVDDSATLRIYLRRLLNTWGYGVEEAVTGFEGLEKALTTSFDLIVTDVNMPIMSGYAMVTALRKEITTQKVPIIMISTEAQESDMKKAYAAGANLYLVKPLDPDVLKPYIKFTAGETE
jgi:two-component system chemotaxis response regulator CheY